MKKICLFFIFALALLIPATGCFAGGPWRGKVIETETKKPIEGAVVVAVWYSETTLNPAGSSSVPMNVVETETNAKGEFYFSSKYFLDVPILRQVTGPDFLVYKPGYDVFQISYVSKEHPLYKNELAIIERQKLEKKEDRLKAYDWAGSFGLRFRESTPKLNKLRNSERKFLGFND